MGSGGGDGWCLVDGGRYVLCWFVVLCGGEPTNITQQLWSFLFLFLFLFPRLPPGILFLFAVTEFALGLLVACCLFAEVPGLN
jgi:hypothetical protein